MAAFSARFDYVPRLVRIYESTCSHK